MRTLTVESFGYTPMKGTRHTPRKFGEIQYGKLLHDRRLCLVDAERQQVLRTVQHPQLMEVEVSVDPNLTQARFDFGADALEITLESSQQLCCDYWGRTVDLQLIDSPVNEKFSDFLNKKVTLAQAPAGAIIFGEPFSIMGTATLVELGKQLDFPELLAKHARFRSTFLVQTGRPFEEEEWGGEEVMLVGAALPTPLLEMKIQIGAPIGRCAVIDSNPTTGVRDRNILKHLGQTRPRTAAGEPQLGVYAQEVNTLSG